MPVSSAREAPPRGPLARRPATSSFVGVGIGVSVLPIAAFALFMLGAATCLGGPLVHNDGDLLGSTVLVFVLAQFVVHPHLGDPPETSVSST